MRREEAIALVLAHKNDGTMIHPVELLDWTWLYVILNKLSDEAWEAALNEAVEVLSK